jgi:hypothetical protein
MKKFFSKVFKSRAFKIFMVPMVMVAAIALGAGAGYLTTSQTAPASAEGVSITRQPSDLYSRLGKDDNSTNTYAPGPSAETGQTVSTVSKPSSKPKTKAPKTPTCNQQSKTYYSNQRDIALQNENQKYSSFTNPYDQTNDPTNYQAEQDKEDARHNSALAQINNNYQNQLASIHCS